MTSFRRILPWVFLALLLALALTAVRLHSAEPEWARKELLTRLRKECPACRFEVRELDLDLISGKVVARGVGFLGNPEDGTHFGATAEALTVEVKLPSLWKKTPWIKRLRVDGLDLVVADYARTKPNTEPPSYPFLATLPPVHVEKLEVRNSKFRYALDPPAQQKIPNPANVPEEVSVADVLKHKDHFGFLQFHSIDADFGPFGTKREFSPDFVEAMATAEQGKKARIQVAVKLGLFENEKVDDIDIKVKTAELSEINSMFIPAEGLKIGGFLHQGLAKIEVRKRKLTSTVRLEYDALDVEYVKGYEGRSNFKTTVSNMVSSAMVDKEKKANNTEGQSTGTVTIEQKPFDNVFTFIVEGLRGSIKQIVSSD